MKKILYIIIILLITGCKNDTEAFLNIDNKYNLPKNWQEKSSVYGDFYSDYESIIIVLDDNNDFYSIQKSFNYYKSLDFRLISNWEIIKDGKEFEINTNGEKYKFIKGKKIDNKIICISSISEEKIDEIYKKVFE